jgi:hypothetical protein
MNILMAWSVICIGAFGSGGSEAGIAEGVVGVVETVGFGSVDAASLASSGDGYARLMARCAVRRPTFA